MAKSVKKSAGAKKAMATKRAKSGSNSKGVKNAFVELAKNERLCLRERKLGGGYVRGSGSKCKKVRVITRTDDKGNVTITSYRDPILNPKTSRKISAARKKAANYRRKKRAA